MKVHFRDSDTQLLFLRPMRAQLLNALLNGSVMVKVHRDQRHRLAFLASFEFPLPYLSQFSQFSLSSLQKRPVREQELFNLSYTCLKSGIVFHGSASILSFTK